MPCGRWILASLQTWITLTPHPTVTSSLTPQPAQLACHALRRRLCRSWFRRGVQRCGGRGRVLQAVLEFIKADALLAVGFGFCGAVGVDAAFGEEVGATACYY